MKSKFVLLNDYRSIVPDIQAFAPDEEALDRELQRLTNPYIRWEVGSAVSAGDQVVCCLVSDCPRFHKENVRFVAGSGMFQKELEALSIGMSVGETREAQLPEGRVTLTVQSVMNRVVPAVSNEMVEKLGLENIHTVEDYRAYLLGQQKESAFQKAAYEPEQRLMETVITGSEFVLYKEDWAALVNRELERCRELFRQEGIVMEEATAEQFNGRIPVKSYHEFVAMLQYESWDKLCRHLLGRRFAEDDGFSVGEADYEAFLADYVKTWHTTEEKARRANTYENYVFNEYGWHAYQVLTNYIREFF
ncbi:MAG: hypothetical protein K2P20_02895 [Oscillospiraceae bacterium]|nr:hypothetical protein [Oscillospiraceae bacterium]